MGWTVIIEDEDGNAIKTMPDEFVLSDVEVLNNKDFKVLKYLDPFGDTTFNALMLADLLNDLIELKELLPTEQAQINTVIAYARDCKEYVHTYLNFYGD